MALVLEMVTLKVDSYHIKDYGWISDLNGETTYGIPKEIIWDYECRGYEIETEFILNPILPCYEPGFFARPIPQGTFIVRAVKYDME